MYDGTWEHGRELASMSKGTTIWTYTYDANGMRTSRSNGTTTYTYVYNGGLLMQMSDGTNVLYFTYDTNGHPLTVTLNGTLYYYTTNPQGDVTGIWNSTDDYICAYYYDAWGKVTRTTTYVSSDIATLNPLRYRGYVYDQDTGLYYLQSRYYNPEWGRFINADSFVSTGQGVLSNNMFSYCLNNSVNCYDPSGNATFSICNGDRNPLFIGHIGLGGGGGGGSYGRSGLTSIAVKTNGKLSDHQESMYGGTSHGIMLPWEFDLFSVSQEGLIIADAEVALLEGCYEWEHTTLTLARIFSAEVSCGFDKEDGLQIEAMASMISSGIAISLGFVEIEVVGHLGAVGGKVSLTPSGVTLGMTHAGVGGEVSIRWDIE